MFRRVQGNIKESSKSLGLFVLKVASGALLGLVIALVLKGLMGIAQFGFIFVIVFMAGAFLRLSKKWKWQGILLFNLFCVMTAMLLRMYILIAPGE